MDNSGLLRVALRLNAAFSGLSGLVLILLPETMGLLLGFSSPAVFLVIGVGLLGFSADLIHQATRERMAGWRALYASLGDVLWVLGSVVGVLVWADYLTAVGVAIVLAVAALVLCFGIAQLAGLNKLYYQPADDCYAYAVKYQTQTPAEAMWQVIRKINDIDQYMSALASSSLEEASQGESPVRICEDRKGRKWRERCVEFSDRQRMFDVEFLTSDPGFPYPATWMIGGWRVEKRLQGSEISVWWQLQPKPKWMAPVLMAMLAFSVDRSFPAVIRNMEARALSGNADAESANPTVTALSDKFHHGDGSALVMQKDANNE